MTTIAPIGAITGPAATGYLAPTQAPEPTGGAGFAAAMTAAVDQTQALQGNANTLAVKAATGDLTDVHDATIAATRAQVTLELVAALRNKAVDGFNEIMRMQA